MIKRALGITVGLALVLMLGRGIAWAETKVTDSREESKPQKIEVKVGEEVRWINATGGTAHVAFAAADGISFYIGKEGRVPISLLTKP